MDKPGRERHHGITLEPTCICYFANMRGMLHAWKIGVLPHHTYLLPLWNALSLYIYFLLAFLLSYCSFLFSCTCHQLNTLNHCLRKVLQVFLLFIMEQEIEQTLICISILWHQFLLNLCLPSVFIGCFDPA